MPSDKKGAPSVLQVISHLDMGGAENIAISLAEELHTDFDFAFFAVSGLADNPVGREMQGRLRALNVPVYSGTALDLKRGGLLQAGLRLGRLISGSRPGLVHLHTEIPEATFGVAALPGLPAGVGVMRTIHNSKLWPAWQRVGRWAEGRLGAAEVVAVSQASLQGLWQFQRTQRLPLTPDERTRVIYNGVADVAGPGVRVARASLSGRPVRVLFAGRLEPEKGVDLLPAVLTEASRLTGREVEVTLLGHGALEEQVRSWVRGQTTSWKVTLGDPVPNLPGRLGEYDVLLMPSRFEGLALVAIEALLAGTPVVGTRAPGLSEVFPAGYPLLADPEDVAGLSRVLARAVDHAEHYAAVVERDRTFIAERFSLQSMADGYRRTYHAALSPGRVAVAP